MFKKCDLITTPEHTGLLRVMNNAKKILYVAFLNPQTDQVICYGHLHVSKATHATLEEIAAGHRIDKSPLMRHLNECEEVVKKWPKWKLQSVRDAFGIPRHTSEANDMGDDSHIENHISKNCKVIDYE